MSKEIDAKVLDLFHKVNDKKKKLGTPKKHSWKTSCTIGKDPANVSCRINIQTLGDYKTLVDIYSFLMMQKEYWDRASKVLGIGGDFIYMAYSFEDWEADIKARIEQISVLREKKELAVLEKRLDALITTDQRRELELAEIEALMKDS